MVDKNDLQDLVDDIDDFDLEETMEYFEVWLTVKDKDDVELGALPIDLGYTSYDEAKKCFDYVAEHAKDLDLLERVDSTFVGYKTIELVLLSTIDSEVENMYEVKKLF